ncbi:MAG: non-heme iron oxygenase ferredoxin subunit [Deltaproteobacteria bacterium]|nr:non-heme iron oxygenase ferredoxin subunit [Deltaproteobacteria bacterium]
MSAVTFHPVAKVSEVEQGEVRRVSVGEREIALYNLDGQYYATDDTCSHAQASLSDGFIDGGEVECPLHGARFVIQSGEVAGPPAEEPIATYPTRVQGDTVYVGLPSA